MNEMKYSQVLIFGESGNVNYKETKKKKQKQNLNFKQ